MKGWIFAALLAGGMLVSPVSLAMDSPDDKAKEWYESGKIFYQEARYEEALVSFETAYRLSSRPTLLRSIGYCYEKLDRLNEALDVFHRWLGLADPANHSEIERHIRRIEQAIEAASQVPSPPPRRPGSVFQPQPQSQPQPQLQPQSQQGWSRPSDWNTQSEAQHKRTKWRMGTGPVVLYGVSGVSAITGTVFAVQADQARKAAAELCSIGDAVFCTGAASGSISRDRTFSGIADLSFGVGGAAIVVGTLWMVIDNSKNTAVQIGPVGQGLGLLGTF